MSGHCFGSLRHSKIARQNVHNIPVLMDLTFWCGEADKNKNDQKYVRW